MSYKLSKMNVGDAPISNAKIFLINRYAPPTSPFRWAQDLLSILEERATLVNLQFDPNNPQFYSMGINFQGRFKSFPSLNISLRKSAFANFRKFIENVAQKGGKTILHYTNQFSGTFRISNVTEIVNVQDSPFYVENLSIFEKLYLRSLYNSLKREPYIVTNTEHLKDELISFGFKGEITTIYLPYSPVFRHLSVEKRDLRMKLGLPLDKKLILSVSTDSPRKNLPTVNKVMDKLGEDFKLVRVGSSLGNSITFRGIDDETLNEIYNACDVLLFPSLYEGFGLPIIEAFAAGLPVVSSDIPTIREIGRNAATLCDPHDVDDLKKSVNFALDNADRLSEVGIKEAMKFSYYNFRHDILKLYSSIEEEIS